MNKRAVTHDALRIFAMSAIVTVLSLIGVLWRLGGSALYVVTILVIVEITFSFDNAIINAKVLGKLSQFWQRMFLTVGIVVAIIGMRVVFPILIVAFSARLVWSDVVNLALYHPKQYGHELTLAHPLITAFGGAFLLMLALQFFFDDERNVMWLHYIERKLQHLSHWAWAPVVTMVCIVIIAMLPNNGHEHQTIIAGGLGMLSYFLLQLLVRGMEIMGKTKSNSRSVQTGLAAFITFIYLQILDASFSFDGVIGAFAITSNIIIIAIGLGIGAIWVRSLTVYMVRKKALGQYRYLEHGAHYTVLMLAIIMLISTVWDIPDMMPGLVGIGVIAASLLASIRVKQLTKDVR